MNKIEPKIIEAEVEVVSSAKNPTAKQSNPKSKHQQSANPFAGFGGTGATGAMPDISAMFGNGNKIDLSKIPGLSLRQRLTIKILSLIASPKLRFLKSKWSIPLWGLITVIIFLVVVSLGVTFLIYKLAKAILSPYFGWLKKSK